MSPKLWDRGEPLDAVVERFTVGRDPELDLRLAAFDALASAAHARMLHRIGILDEQELAALIEELAAIAEDAQAGRFTIEVDEEDCHTAIENRLILRKGEVGRRIHTGRSRNDQVLAALRLYGREMLLHLSAHLLEVVDLLLTLARQHARTSIPGYTHTRQAMPSTLGLLFSAHAEALLDAVPWLQTAFAHVNRSPLGSASGYGVPLPLDRRYTADLLGFDAVQHNTLAVQNDRGRTEYLVLGAVATPCQDLGRLAADLIWFSSDELGFVKLSSDITTGSSIMPNKRNPDVLELIRASAARVRSRQAEIGSVMGQLVSGYHRDYQLTKEPFVEGMQTAADMFRAVMPVLRGLEVDAVRCREAMLRSIGATDVVYQQVASGVAFRTAYKTVARDPEAAVEGDPSELWRARTHLGAPGALELEPCADRANAARQWIEQTRGRLSSVSGVLSDPAGGCP